MKKALCLLLCLATVFWLLPAAGGEPSLSVAYALPNGRTADALTDADVMTRITVAREQSITLTLSHADAGRTCYLEWYAIPQDAVLLQLNERGETVSETVFSLPSSYTHAFALDASCTRLYLRARQECTVSTLFVSETAPSAAYHWLSPTTACDLLLIAPTPASVLETFGSVLAHYGAAHGVSVGIVCMTVDHRYCADELEAALAAMGFQNAPIYLGCVDENYLTGNEVHNRWAKNNPEAKLRALLAALQPKVVVTVDAAENDLRAIETAAIVAAAAEGTDVQKLYIASEAGETVIDCAAPLLSFGNLSACEYATKAYRLMASRGMYRRLLADAPAFRLAVSAVGDDVQRDDLLEHIDRQALASYRDLPTPAPVETVTPAVETAKPTEAVTASPTAKPTETPSEAPAETPKPKRGLFSCGGVEITPSPVPTAAPTASPAPTPTREPISPAAPATESPSPVPTPTPIPVFTYETTNFDEHFLQPGEAEYVFFDNENGEWIYRSDILAVEIKRYAATYPYGNGEKPVVYFVADIYEREYDSFRPTFGSWRHDGMQRSPALQMATEAKCVLWITGDNLINSDVEIKGSLIRDGYVFRRSAQFDTMVLDPKTKAMRIVHAGEIGTDALYESGVENCFSFGPVLVENGEIRRDAAQYRKIENPRTMLGMIEPGHFVSVVVDGRQPGYSQGLNSQECAELMASLGCVTAYNLDGGMSACMIFLGNKINRHSASSDQYKGMSAGIRTMPDGLSWGYSELCGTFRELQEDNG